MIEFIHQIFSTVFGDNVILATILISMVPIIEVKGAIPFAMSEIIWGSRALSGMEALAFSLIGSSIIVPLLALLYFPLIRWLKGTRLFRHIAEKIENRVNRHKDRVDGRLKSAPSRKVMLVKILGVLSFVMLPLPLTGVWTGTCLAVALGLSFPLVCITVIAGNVISGLLVTFFSHLMGGSVTLIIVLSIIAVLSLAFLTKRIIDVIVTRHARKEQSKTYIEEDTFAPSAEDQE